MISFSYFKDTGINNLKGNLNMGYLAKSPNLSIKNFKNSEYMIDSMIDNLLFKISLIQNSIIF